MRRFAGSRTPLWTNSQEQRIRRAWARLTRLPEVAHLRFRMRSVAPYFGLALTLAACTPDSLSRPPAASDTGIAADTGASEPDTGAPFDSGDFVVDAGFDDLGTLTDAGLNDTGAVPDTGTEPPPPPGLMPIPPYTEGACPTLVAGNTGANSVNTGFVSNGIARDFRLLVPMSYDGSQPMPVVFAWHWLNASSNSFVRDGELESAIEEMGFIMVLPDKRKKANGDKEFLFDWPFVETWGEQDELVFLDDTLSCVNEQYNIDRERIYGIGVSAGGLWVTHLSTTDRSGYFAAIESLSGGLGEVLGAWSMSYMPQPNKFPTMVLWGGSGDWLGVNFNEASQRYRDALLADNHFVLECVHDAGHAMPPIEPPPGQTTKFFALWQFMLDHPFGLAAGDSPYLTQGIPAGFPEWCSIP